MITPNVPHQSTPVIQEDGTMNDSWHSFFSQVTEALQKNISQEGITVAAQPASNIVLLNTQNHTQKFIYDSTSSVMKVNNNGVFKRILTEP